MLTTTINLLERGIGDLQEAVSGLSAEQAARIPAPGKWSVLEIVEHLAVSENGMFSAFALARPSEVSLENPEKEARLFERVSGRAEPLEAPERSRPAGRFADLNQALAAFLSNRRTTIDFARQKQDDVCFMTVKHPLAGVISGHELLLIMAAHPIRHAKQIWEIRS